MKNGPDLEIHIGGNKIGEFPCDRDFGVDSVLNLVKKKKYHVRRIVREANKILVDTEIAFM